MDAPAAFRMASTFTSATPLRIACATAAPDWRKLTFSGTVTVVSPLEGTGGASGIAMRPTVEPAMSTVPRIPRSGEGAFVAQRQRDAADAELSARLVAHLIQGEDRLERRCDLVPLHVRGERYFGGGAARDLQAVLRRARCDLVALDFQVVAGAGQVEADGVRVGDQEHQIQLGAAEVHVWKAGLLEGEGRPLEHRRAGLPQQRATEKERKEQR